MTDMTDCFRRCVSYIVGINPPWPDDELGPDAVLAWLKAMGASISVREYPMLWHPEELHILTGSAGGVRHSEVFYGHHHLYNPDPTWPVWAPAEVPLCVFRRLPFPFGAKTRKCYYITTGFRGVVCRETEDFCVKIRYEEGYRMGFAPTDYERAFLALGKDVSQERRL